MEKKIKNKNIGLTILKVVAIVILSFVLIFVGGYVYLKYTLGFDLVKFKRAVDLLNKSYSESSIIVNGYSDDDIVSGFNKMFGENSVYYEQEGQYVFNKQEYDDATLQDEVLLSDTELCGILNLYISNFLGEEVASENNNVNLKQIIFSNLVDEEEFVSVDLEFSFVIDIFDSSTNKEGVISFFSQFFPSKILLTSKICFKYSKTDCFNYSTTSISFKINNLTTSEIKEILEIINSLKITNSDEEIVAGINKIITDSLFGENGFVVTIDDSAEFEFVYIENNVYLKLKKV